jgi:glucose-1-phosphate adenylyltransferase
LRTGASDADDKTEAEMLSSARVQQRLTQRALALILAGGRGSRLKQLTDRRAKPAVFFGGKFRIVDFALSNCLNSGLRRIAVLTQYKAHSLLRHLQMGWSFLRPEMNEFLDLLPAQQRLDEATWYRGTTDAVYQNFDIFRAVGPRYFLVLAGDHIYKMDYSNMLADHVDKGADCTVACVEVPLAAAADFGIMKTDPSMRIVDFLEKPKNPPPIPGKPDRALASMGVYVFTADFLYAELERDHRDLSSSHDFGRDLIPNLVGRGLAMAHSFEESCVKTTPEAEAYWRDVGTIDAYWAANLDLVMPTPSLDIYDPNWPIWTYQQQLPPAKFVFDDDNRRGMAVDSMVSGGCIISGAAVRHSLLFSSVRVNSFARTAEAVLLPEVDVGRHARLSRVVVDRGCHIPEGIVIGEDPDLDAKRFARSEGGVSLVTAEMLAALS